MKNFLICVCLMAALLAALAPCIAATPANGVITKERVITLPQDQGAWYLSVVGDPQDARFKEIQSWFDGNDSLLKLRNSTHYNVVTDGSAIFNERYESNTPALPMIRIQNAEGVVYSQLCEDEIPVTADALSAKIADEMNAGPKTGCILRSIRQWRKEHYLPTIQPNPRPVPVVPIVIPDIRPSPINPLPPILEMPKGERVEWWMLAPLCLACFAVGVLAGIVVVYKGKWKKTT